MAKSTSLQTLIEPLNRMGDVIRLTPQIVGRFYGDGNRLGQRAPGARKPAYYKPERWICSSTLAVNPPGIPSGGISPCPELPGRSPIVLKQLLADPELGPRLLGEKRFVKHQGTLRLLIKILDAAYPIPLHVHAHDNFVHKHPTRYPHEKFGKDEAYHFLDVPKGNCPHTHLGLYPGVDAKTLISAMRRSTDELLELSPAAYQNYHEGFMVKGGLMHRPGTALTLEIQQPSDVYAFFQTDFGGAPLAEEVWHPCFDTQEECAAAIIDWKANYQKDLFEANRLRPSAVKGAASRGGKVEWIFPPEQCPRFSGVRLTVESELTYRATSPMALWVWRGQGTLDGRAIDGGGGKPGKVDEFFVGQSAAERGITLKNKGKSPLIVFALFPAPL